jgi:hypothetical protein
LPIFQVVPELLEAVLHRHIEGGEGVAPHDAIDVQTVPSLYLAHGLGHLVIKPHLDVEIGRFAADLRELAERRQIAGGPQTVPQGENALTAGAQAQGSA